MQLSQSNYLQFRDKIDWSRMPAALTDKPKSVADNAAAQGWADMGEQTQKATDQFFKLCNALVAKDATLLKSDAGSTHSAPSASATKPKRNRTVKAATSRKPSPSKLTTELPPNMPKAKEVPVIATPTAFIKRYVAMHGKVKPRLGRGSILELVHSLQKAITEGRISAAHPCSAEIAKMQSGLIKLFQTMGDHGKIEIDPASLSHYKEIAEGEEVRTSVRLLKQFIQINGKSPDKVKAEALGKKLASAYDTIPKEDQYRSELAAAAKSVASYASGETKLVSIPAATLHGLGSVAAGVGFAGLGLAQGKADGAIIGLLRLKGVKDLSERSLKSAFRNTTAPGLCLEIAKSLIRRGKLTLAMLSSPAVKKKPIGLSGQGNPSPVYDGRSADLDVLDMRLKGAHSQQALAGGLGALEPATAAAPLRREQSIPVSVAAPRPIESISAKELAKMSFKTIGYNGRFKDVVGDPAVGFHMMVYGKPYNGKSSFVIELCKDLATIGKGRIAYLALEEGISLSMQKKVIDRGADKVDGLEFKGAMPASFAGYSFIVIDSVSDRSISREKLREIFLANPDTCFICIFHATKAGSARGGLDYSHDMDIIIKIEDHKPVVEKNRFL